jgi:hypothetical protein
MSGVRARNFSYGNRLFAGFRSLFVRWWRPANFACASTAAAAGVTLERAFPAVCRLSQFVSLVAHPRRRITGILPLPRVTNPDDACAGQYFEIARGIRNRPAENPGSR